MINLDEFKSQLLEFVEWRSEPFDAGFIYKSCIQPVDNHHIHESLYLLECEGKIIRLSDGRYASLRTAIRHWIRAKFVEIRLPGHLIQEIEWTLKLKPRLYRSIEEFIQEAIEEYVRKVKTKKLDSDFNRPL